MSGHIRVSRPAIDSFIRTAAELAAATERESENPVTVATRYGNPVVAPGARGVARAVLTLAPARLARAYALEHGPARFGERAALTAGGWVGAFTEDGWSELDAPLGGGEKYLAYIGDDGRVYFSR